MSAPLEYAPNGLIGVLVPQANTTVEPELAILAPPRTGMITARLTSDKAQMQDRLIDYGAGIDRSLDQFANAPVDVAVFACTGASYLVEPAVEAARLAEVRRTRGYEMITAPRAVLDALSALGATRVSLISPYAGGLHDKGLTYWQARGLDLVEVRQIANDDAAFHPIYTMSGAASVDVLDEMIAQGPEAIVILGTGLASLPAILAAQPLRVPVISPNLCLMWRSACVLGGQDPDSDTLRPWLTGACWADRYAAWVRHAD